LTTVKRKLLFLFLFRFHVGYNVDGSLKRLFPRTH
jgi:hypothetical protein